MTEEDKFHKYLSEFQNDILGLIGSKRRHNHLMSVEEIASDLNLALIKKKDAIINFRNDFFDEFNFESFRFQVCCYIKNAIGWYQCRKKQEKFYTNRDNYSIKTYRGQVSTFESLEQTKGIESDFDFDKNSKHTYFLKLIKNYSEFLTKNEIQLIDLILEGYKQVEISEILGVTHQAVSFNIIRLEDKLRCRVKDDYLQDESWENISIGNNAMEELFSNEKR